MWQPELSVLICSVVSRRELLAGLIGGLDAQIAALADPGRVEVLTAIDDGKLCVGDKRNRLMARASGRYLCFVDDDDRVTMDYVKRILTALETGPDVVGLCGIVTFDNRRAMVFRESMDYRKDRDTSTLHERLLNHLCPTRADLARQFPFPEINCFEDSQRARAMVGAFSTCVTIEEPIYIYDYRPARSLTQGPGNRR